MTRAIRPVAMQALGRFFVLVFSMCVAAIAHAQQLNIVVVVGGGDQPTLGGTAASEEGRFTPTADPSENKNGAEQGIDNSGQAYLLMIFVNGAQPMPKEIPPEAPQQAPQPLPQGTSLEENGHFIDIQHSANSYEQAHSDKAPSSELPSNEPAAYQLIIIKRSVNREESSDIVFPDKSIAD